MANNIINKLPGSVQENQVYKPSSDKPFINELYARGVSLRLEGKIEQARDHFKLVMQDDASLIWPRIQFAFTTRRLGDYHGSIIELEKLLKELPELANNDKRIAASINNGIGNAHFSNSNHKEAFIYFEKAFNLAKEVSDIDYASKIASNMAWMMKDSKDYVNSKVWLVKSNQIRKENNLSELINNLFLLGQLEYLMNNFDKAESIYNDVAQKYISTNKKGNAVKVFDNLAKIKRDQGKWLVAKNYIEKALNINQELNNELNRLLVIRSLISLLFDQGKYSEALSLIEDNKVKSLELNQEKLYKNTMQQKMLVLYKQKKYQQSLDIYYQLPVKKFIVLGQFDGFEVLALRMEYLLGNKNPLKQWLLEYQSIAQNDEFENDLIFDAANIFILEQNSKVEELKQAYRRYISKCHAKGLYAKATRYLLKFADLNISENDYVNATNHFNEIQLFELNWWQIDVLKAQLEFNKGNLEKAQSLISEAKNNSTESWSEKHQAVYDEIMSSTKS